MIYSLYKSFIIIIIIILCSQHYLIVVYLKRWTLKNDKKKTVVLNFSPVFTLFFGAQLRALIS